MDKLGGMTLTTKSAPLGGRVIRFIGSDENLDRDGDTISVDGWDIAAYMKNPTVLYGHDYMALPIAKTVSVIPNKQTRQLLFDIQFPTIEELSSNPDTPSEHALRVDAIFNMAKAGILNAVSVGFRGVDYEASATGRNYTHQELLEISLVPIPANSNAIAVLRTAGVSDLVMKGVMTMETKGNRKLSKESRAYIAERVEALSKACDDLKAFIADEPDEDEAPAEPEPPKTGAPVVGEETGTNENEAQPKYVIDLVEKHSAS